MRPRSCASPNELFWEMSQSKAWLCPAWTLSFFKVANSRGCLFRGFPVVGDDLRNSQTRSFTDFTLSAAKKSEFWLWGISFPVRWNCARCLDLCARGCVWYVWRIWCVWCVMCFDVFWCVWSQVLVVGPSDSGKSTLCRLLLSYAARAGTCYSSSLA